jgi:type II secretory pathway component GspD/PulD (secretin)
MKRLIVLCLIILSVCFAEDKLISATFDDMDVAAVIKLLSKEGNLNIISPPDMRGRVTGSFDKVPPEDVLKSVLASLGYTYVVDGSVFRVVRDEQKLNQLKSFKLSYASIDQVQAELIKAVPSLKDRLMVSKETNSILVKTNHPEMSLIKDIINGLDTPPLQVMVEAKIFEVSAEDAQKFGIKTSATLYDGSRSGKADILTNENSEQTIGLYYKTVNDEVHAYITALEAHSDVNILSTPKVIAANNREAVLETMSEVAYVDETTAYTSGGTVTTKKVNFKNVGTTLKFIPHINEKNTITLDLYPEVSTSITGSDGYPLTQKTKVHTQIVARNGETFLIGGLIRDREENLQRKVPVLGDIPFIGGLFRHTEKVVVKKEVMIMITPTILKTGK